MTTNSEVSRLRFAARIPASLKAEAEHVAAAEGTTLNALISRALAEKISALKTAGYFAERGARGDVRRAKEILRKAGKSSRCGMPTRWSEVLLEPPTVRWTATTERVGERYPLDVSEFEFDREWQPWANSVRH